MATNTSGGTTSSFMNTPQAKDDLYNVYEDNIWTFDVMANDLGGNAKILWSIDDSNLDGTFGVPASGDGTYDLLKQDAALVPELSDLGARIWIDSGKIKYDASLFNYLGAGQSISDHFTYAIRMSNGTLSWATVTVTITGTNDGPDIRLVGIDSASAGIAESNSGLSANGTLTVFDPDTADSVNVSVSSVSVGGTGGTGGLTNAQLLGMLSLTGNNANAANGTQGSLGWWFNSGSQAFDYLAVGQTLVLTYTLIGTDGNGGSDTQPVTITITGTNDGPDIRLVGSDSASAGIAESNSGLSANGTLTVFDPDTADSVNVSVSSVSVGGTGGTGGLTNAQLLGMLSLTGNNANAANGTQGSLGWWFNSGSQAFDYLAVGQTLVLTYTLIGTDGNGGSDTQPVTITITGTNDGPTANADTASTDEDSSVLINVLANDTDPDTSDTLVVTAAAVTTGLGAATIESGQVRYDPGSAYNYLAVGESETVVITYSISDGNGGTSTSTATVTVTGTNDGPTANADTASTDEDSSVLINVLANDTDPDTSDTLVVTAAAVTTGLGAATIESGQVRYDPGSAYNYLAVGESETVVITYSISDGNGGTSTSTATVTVTGTNDGPTANADTASTDEDSSVLINVLANDTDPDTSDTLVVTAAAVTTGLGAATIESGQVRYDPGSAYNYLAVGESETVVITYSISDGNGGTSTSTATVTVTGTNDGPTANADTASTDEDSSVLINVLANDTDPDTSDTLVVTAAAVTTGLGAATIESGQVRYDPGSAYNYLAVGESETVVITYSISDGNGGTSTSTATVTVTGTNDGPTANADTASTDEDSSVLINVLANDTDPDTSDTLVVTAAAVTTGLGAATIESGQVRYDPGSAYNYLAVGESETVVITYSISDGNGGTSTSTATVTVTGTNDGPTANADTASTDEDSSVLINVLANDTDPDTSDTLVVTAAAVTTGLGAATIESGQVRYDPGSAYNYLAVGESETVVITYSISDGNGGTSTSTATVTVTGTNDGPTANADTASTDEDSSVLINVLANDTDPDTSDTLVVTAAAVTTGLGAATIESGQVRYDPGSAYNYLAVGESETVVITYSISDGNGGTSTSTATVTVTGTNDGPDIRAAAGDSASATLPETNAGLTASGTLTVTDADTTDTISTSIALTTVTGNAGSLTNPQLLAMLSVTPNSGLAANTGDANNLTWNFNSGGQAFNYLPAGQSLQLTYTLTVSDGNGGTDTQNVTVTIQGTNDAPVLTGDFAAPINEGGSYQLTLADLNFTDSDDSAADVTFTVSGLSNGTLFVNGVAQSTFTGAQLAAGLVTFTHNGSETITAGFNVSVEDGNEDASAPVAQPFNFTVTPVNDAPVNTVPGAQSVNEDTAKVFSTANGNAISISDADAGSNNVQVTLSVASGTLTMGSLVGLTVTAGANGSSTVTVQGTQAAINAGLQGLTYQGNLNFNGGDSLSIVTSDLGNSGSGGALTDTDSVAITVNAVNDAPVIDVNGANTYTISGPAIVIDSSIPISDVDSTQLNGATIQITGGRQAGDTLNFTNQNGISGSYNSSTGLLTLTGTATLANYQAALQSITFGTTSLSTTQRTITFEVTDTGNTPSATDTAVVNIAADTTAPTIVSEVVTSATGIQAGRVNAGDVVSVTVTMSEVVNVTGTPRLALNIGGTTVQANYASGSGTNTLVFTYTILAGQTDTNGIAINANALTLNGGTIRDTSNNNAVLTAGAVGDNAAFIVDTTAPTVVSITSSPSLSGNTATSTVTFQFSEAVSGFDLSDLTVSPNRGTLSNLIQVDGDTYTATFTRTNNGSVGINVGTGYLDLAGNTGTAFNSPNLPAGVAGEPINLGLSDPTDQGALVTVTIGNLPEGWTLDGGTLNADGSWTILTTDVSSLTVTTPADYAGAELVNVSISWTNSDGSTETMSLSDNIEAYAAGNPIFAWSGDDTLTGSAGADMFVFSQPIGADTVHNFDVSADTIDLIGYGVSDFSGLSITDTAEGALITLADGQSILLDGVSLSSLTASNFVFDVSPTVTNSGTITIGNGAMLPLSGTIDNSGTISLESAGATTVMQLIQYGITLQGGGNLVLSDSASNVISGTLPTVTFTNVDNVISGAGQLGGGSLTLINGGTIVADGGNALVIDTGVNAVTNTGTIEATGLGGLEIVGTISNSGTLLADGSSILIGGNLTGSGDVLMNGISTVEFGAGSSNDVTLDAGASGLIVFDDADGFSGSISGLDFNDQIDLLDVVFDAGTSMSFADNGNGSGVLTITDATHSVQLVLVGDYRIEDFILASNGQGGSLLTNNVGDLLFP